MTRSVMALVVCLCSTTTSWAALSANGPVMHGRDLARIPAKAVPAAPQPGLAGEFSLTRTTEVVLDGLPCDYRGVPAGAVVQRIEVAPDLKTIVRIEFRTPR